jgi:UDP-N-acetylmuramyl pentapeptide phosphotransferase/UDP-N-acetylglucosamine-1-phosphate transferase
MDNMILAFTETVLSGPAMAFLLAALVTWAVLFPVTRIARRLKIMDVPGHRSSHEVPVPRIGGTGIIIGVLVASIATCRGTAALAIASAMGSVVAIVSFLDDLFTLPSMLRLTVHLCGAGLVIYIIGLEVPSVGLPFPQHAEPLPKIVGLILATLFVVGFLNFFNFMDGINGISSVQGIIGGITLSILFAMHADANSVIISAAIAGGCLGFLPHNFPKAKIFMGDVGSTAVGFALAMLTVVGAARTSIPWVAFLLPFSLYIYDGAFTLTKRIIRRENFLKPHREHHYQLLIRSGWSHVTVTGIYTIQFIACSASAVLYAYTKSQYVRLGILLALLGWVGIFSILVHRYFARKGQEQAESPKEQIS